MRRLPFPLAVCLFVLTGTLSPSRAAYINFESAHVHPIAVTPSGARLVAVNTPDAVLEVFALSPDGTPTHERSVPVGLEPVSVTLRNDREAWVVNQLSDSVSVADLVSGVVVRTLEVGDEPTDVAFASGRAFVSLAGEHAVRVYDLANLDAASTTVDLFTLKPRALAAAPDGTKIYAVPLFSGNRTTVLNANTIFGTGLSLVSSRLTALGLNDIDCNGAPPPYPPLPAGVERNPALTDPPPASAPEVGLIVAWDDEVEAWVDDAGQDWNHCLPYRLADHDLFVIDAASLAVATVDHLGTSLFDVSVNPGNGKLFIPHTEARNAVRFELEEGVRGHIVENRLAVVDPAQAFAATFIDLNTHIDRGSDPATNLAERAASISQPGMLAWNATGSVGWLTGIGTRKLFRVDGGCGDGACIFGADRGAPAAVEVGEGPTGVALLPGADRGYVLLRFTNSIALVDTLAATKLGEVALHDPSPAPVLEGRRFLYDAIDGSGHGDASCASCHLFGDRDGLAWDLGDPTGDFVPYARAMDNVRFVLPISGVLVQCAPGQCQAHAGFDPQKGPMTTQTLRGMLEPLHWRGDRATMNEFNKAFVGLMGTADIGPVNGEPAGLSADDMERFRQFSLALAFPSNPHRNLDDSLPNALVPVPGAPFSGNPSTGQTIYNTVATDGTASCVHCHTLPFGAGGGKLGGVTPQEPTSSQAAALFNGDLDGSPHSDLKIPHLRNMHEKIGPVYGDHVSPPPLARSGFGFSHDGSIPDLGSFFSASVFTLSAGQVQDVSAFMAHFPSGTRPAVGGHVTLPPGAPAAKGGADEAKLATLIAVGDLANAGRHCELTASAVFSGVPRRFRLSGGVWHRDAALAPPLATSALREQAGSPINFLCATIGSGLRLGGDRDEDAVLDADDCAPADGGTWAAPGPITGFVVAASNTPTLQWDDQSGATGPALRYEVFGGALADLRAGGLATGTVLGAELPEAHWIDPMPEPLPGEGRWYLVDAGNACTD